VCWKNALILYVPSFFVFTFQAPPCQFLYYALFSSPRNILFFFVYPNCVWEYAIYSNSNNDDDDDDVYVAEKKHTQKNRGTANFCWHGIYWLFCLLAFLNGNITSIHSKKGKAKKQRYDNKCVCTHESSWVTWGGLNKFSVKILL
jgi:hypothetical protein